MVLDLHDQTSPEKPSLYRNMFIYLKHWIVHLLLFPCGGGRYPKIPKDFSTGPRSDIGDCSSVDMSAIGPGDMGDRGGVMKAVGSLAMFLRSSCQPSTA